MKELDEVLTFVSQYVEAKKWIGLDLQEVREFFKAGTIRKVEKNAYLVTPETAVHELYFNHNGIFRYFFKTRKGVEYTKNFVWQPQFFAPTLPDFMVNRPTSSYCQALTDSKIMVWDAKAIFAKADENPIFYKLFFILLAQIFQHKDQKEMDMYEFSAAERYEKFLAEYPGVTNQVPLQYIASYLDMKPETLSRIRSQF
ncbi:MAG: Crp/Fnr family transcriptional regulator [Bacteroidia bacterium]